MVQHAWLDILEALWHADRLVSSPPPPSRLILVLKSLFRLSRGLESPNLEQNEE